jgi:hypothetical protein
MLSLSRFYPQLSAKEIHAQQLLFIHDPLCGRCSSGTLLRSLSKSYIYWTVQRQHLDANAIEDFYLHSLLKRETCIFQLGRQRRLLAESVMEGRRNFRSCLENIGSGITVLGTLNI